VPALTLSVMTTELPSSLINVIRIQRGVFSRDQAIRAGLTPDMIRSRVRRGAWRRLRPGVYTVLTGQPARSARLWAAVLAAGAGAVLSHETAAELHGFAGKLLDNAIHVSIPGQRRIAAIPGVRIHISARALAAAQARSCPPRTTVEETVLDLVDASVSLDDVYGWISRAIVSQLTDQARLLAVAERRHKLRWRADLAELIQAAAEGNESVLEFRYERDVERAHGLPRSDRQVPFTGPGGRRGRRDRVYKRFGLVVELDGKAAHPEETQWRDKARDNAAAVDGQQTMRYDWTSVRHDACATAVQVAKVLQRRGWPGQPKPCSYGCPIGSEFPAPSDLRMSRSAPGRSQRSPLPPMRAGRPAGLPGCHGRSHDKRQEPSRERTAMIEARGLTKRYGEKVAVDDLSFTVRPGRVTGFLGPNGAGKTTTMRLILGLDRPTAGSVTVNGEPFAELYSAMREVGALLDAKAVHGGRSAYHHLLCLAQTNGIPRSRVDEVIGIVGLEDVAGKRSKGFSLGMSQRLGIAAALLGDPDVLMFDEPVNGLDPEGIRWIRLLMRSLAAEGRTVFVSSHLMSEMENTADHLIVIGRGKLIADCPVAEFTADGTAQAATVKTPDGQRLAAVSAAGGTLERDANREFTVRGLSAEQVGGLALANGILLHYLAPARVSLEEAFMELTADGVEYQAKTGAQQ
jgi:ABC-2 type transport system ATP-binding protein